MRFTIFSPTLAVLNMSTSAQMAFTMPPEFVPPSCDQSSTIEYFPYFDGRYVAVAAALTGGNVMHGFVKMLQQWTHELGWRFFILFLIDEKSYLFTSK